jgi:hypothetical protein
MMANLAFGPPEHHRPFMGQSLDEDAEKAADERGNGEKAALRDEIDRRLHRILIEHSLFVP